MKFDFRNLDVWQLAKELRNEINELCRKLPSEEKYRLVDQMIRASRSVTANIAEGHGRYHFQENIQFCRQARGSLFELLDHLTVCLGCNYISESTFQIFESKLQFAIKKLNGYIRYCIILFAISL